MRATDAKRCIVFTTATEPENIAQFDRIAWRRLALAAMSASTALHPLRPFRTLLGSLLITRQRGYRYSLVNTGRRVCPALIGACLQLNLPRLASMHRRRTFLAAMAGTTFDVSPVPVQYSHPRQRSR
jgi:hypothetical protein